MIVTKISSKTVTTAVIPHLPSLSAEKNERSSSLGTRPYQTRPHTNPQSESTNHNHLQNKPLSTKIVHSPKLCGYKWAGWGWAFQKSWGRGGGRRRRPIEIIKPLLAAHSPKGCLNHGRAGTEQTTPVSHKFSPRPPAPTTIFCVKRTFEKPC